jgi:hypothetical protein
VQQLPTHHLTCMLVVVAWQECKGRQCMMMTLAAATLCGSPTRLPLLQLPLVLLLLLLLLLVVAV